MLRLKPSEIVLTPADVDETYRRIARNQARAMAGRNHRSTNPAPVRSSRLQPGPQRSREDALRHLAGIPLLQPQVAEIAFVEVDSGGEEFSDDYDNASDKDQDHAASTEPRTRALNDSTASLPPSSSGLPTAQLVERLPNLPLPTGTAAGNSPGPSPRRPRSSIFGHLRRHSAREVPDNALQPQTQGSSTAALPTTPLRRSSSPTLPATQTTLQQGNHGKQRIGHRPSRSEDPPTLFLQGRFETPDRYVFDEFLLRHTEPPAHSHNQGRSARHISTGSDPSHLSNVYRTSFPSEGQVGPETLPTFGNSYAIPSSSDRRNSTFDDRIQDARRALGTLGERTQSLFRRARGSTTTASQASGSNATPRPRVGSASSNSSLPFSLYELPNSSQPSSSSRSPSATQLPHSQVDGAAPSRMTPRGAYYSVRPSQGVSQNLPARQSRSERLSSLSTPDLPATINQYGHSMLPAQPYSRPHFGQSTQTPSTSIFSQADFAEDAATAYERGLPSPLDIVQRRSASRLYRDFRADLFPSSRDAPLPSSGYRTEFDHSPYVRANSRVNPSQQTPTPRTHGPHSNQFLHPSPGFSSSLSPYPHARQYPLRLPPGLGPFPNPQHAPPARPPSLGSTHGQPRGQNRAHESRRSELRSSENMPVNSTIQHGHSHQNRGSRSNAPSQPQGYPPDPELRGGGLRSSATRPRLSVPPTPRDVSNRSQQALLSRRQTRYSDYSDETLPLLPGPQRHSHHYPINRHASRTEAPRPRRAVRARSPRWAYNGEHASHAPTFYQDISLAGSRGIRHSSHPSVPVATARRPPIPARVASRPLSVHLQNQENSGEAEAGLMREELAVVAVRYGEPGGEGTESMDQTPPRLGRFERHMMGEGERGGRA